jgi:capsular exopolysaccharide synthesis family protein
VPPSSTNGQGPAERTNGAIADLLYDDPVQSDGSQLRELAALLWDGKWILLGALVIAVAAGWTYTYSIPTTYQTSSLVMVDKEENQMIAGLGSTTRRAMGREDRQLQNELLVLRQSMTIANRVADRLLQMEAHPRTGQPLRVLTGPEGAQRSHAQVARQVKGTVSARQTGEGVDALTLMASGRDPQEVALVANLYAEEYVARTREKSRESTQAKLDFLEAQADTLRDQLDAAERRIEEYMQAEGAVALDQETQRVVGRISDLEAKRQELQIELDMTRAAIQQQEEELNEVTPKLAARLSSVTQSRLTQVQEEKATLQARIDRIQRENPSLDSPALQRDLQRLQARKAALAQEADSLAQRYVDEALSARGVRAGGGEDGGGATGVGYVAQQRRELAQKRIEASGLEARLGTLEDQLAEARTTLQEIPSQSMELAQLQRNRNSTERIYGFVQETLQETRLTMQSEMGYAEVVRQAGPGVPVSPDTRKNLMLAALLGLVVGGGLVVLRSKLDTKIHQPSDLRDRGHRLLGAVPSMADLIETEFDGADTVTIDDRSVGTSLVMLTSPMSAAAEGYRRVRTNLQFTRPDAGLQTVMVSSPDQGDGKTTTAANVALAFAGAGKDTLLVDADLRRPRLHDFLNVAREPGLSHALYTDDPDWRVFESSIDRLSVLPAGADVPNPAELLGSQRMEGLMSRLRAQYDYVIVDTPPVLLFSDVLGLGPQCDGTLLVAAADRTDGRAFDHAVEMLTDVDIPVVGAVLNGFHPSRGIRPYSYNYGYAYGYRRMADYYEDDAEPTGTAWFRS